MDNKLIYFSTVGATYTLEMLDGYDTLSRIATDRLFTGKTVYHCIISNIESNEFSGRQKPNKAQWKRELNQVGHCRKPKNV